MAQRVLLTGATGTIGGAVLETLIRKGHEVTILVRDETKGRALATSNGSLCKFVVLEMMLDSVPALKQLAKGFDCVIYAAGASAEVEVAALRAFIQAGIETAGEGSRTQLVFTSDCLVYGDHGAEVITEASSTAGCLAISQHRIALEQEILSASTATFTTTVLRPSWVYPGSGIGEYIQKAKETRQLLIPQTERYLCFVHNEDLADLYARVLEQRAGGIFNAAEPEEFTSREWAETLSKFLPELPICEVPDPLQFLESAGFFALGLSVSQHIHSRAITELGWQPRSIRSILPGLV